MSKYEKSTSFNTSSTNFENTLTDGEELIWSGKPKKSAFIINKSLNMLPIALIWLLFDSTFIVAIFSSNMPKGMLLFIIIFFAFHLMPVWTWLSNVLTAKKRWDNTQYAVTNKRIIISTGFIGMDYQTIYYKDIKNVNLKVGVVDKLLHVGDIHFTLNGGVSQSFLDIENAYEIYPKLQKIVLDIQTDIEFPNDLRPDENHGYNTKYKGQ